MTQVQLPIESIQKGTFQIVDVATLPVREPGENEFLVIEPEGYGFSITRYQVS